MHYKKIHISDDEYLHIPSPQSYADCLRLINSDLQRLGRKKGSLAGVVVHVVTHPFSFLVWFRLASYKGFLRPLCRLMHKLCSVMHQIDIPTKTKIGYGFYIGHGMNVVINSDTIIGNNVNVSQFLNIGTNHNTPAIICDNFYIGPQVCIVDDVRIGGSSTIGAGAIVTRDVPACSTCAGNPARVLNYNNPGRYIGNPYVFTPPETEKKT